MSIAIGTRIVAKANGMRGTVTNPNPKMWDNDAFGFTAKMDNGDDLFFQGEWLVDIERTIDNQPVAIGMTVWDYNLDRAFVDAPSITGDMVAIYLEHNPDELKWYDMRAIGGRPSSTMDAKRMWKRHPSTGELA